MSGCEGSLRFVALVLTVGSASAGIPTVIFSNIAGSPTSDVPGIVGLKFSATPQTVFGAPSGSPDGQRWVFRALASGDIIIAGSGTDGSLASAIVRRHDPTFFDGNVEFLTFRAELGINDAGSFAFSSDTDAPTNSDEIAARWSSADGFALIAREGVQAAAHSPGIGYGTGARHVHMLADDTVAFISGNMTGSGRDAVYLSTAIDAGVVLVQGGVTVPDNQAQPGHALSSDIDTFRIDATAAHYIYCGALTNGHDIIAVDNAVVAERDVPLPGGYPGFFEDPDANDDGASISAYNGHFAFQCPANLGDVVIVDNVVVAATDTPIVPGSPLVWRNGDNSNTPFALNLVNSRGDYVVYGRVAHNGVAQGVRMVMNGRTVILPIGPVDMNGDGLPNDGYGLGSIRVDSAFLTDDGKLFFTAEIGNGQTIGEAFLWARVPRGGDTNCDGAIDFFDIDPFLLALFDEAGYAAAYPDCWRITADINRDRDVNFFDIDPFIACLFAECP